MTNETMVKFGYPDSLIRDYEHWVVLLRPAQVTLGSLVLAAKSDAVAFGDLPEGAHAELATITKELEAALCAEVAYEKINYLMLMMVDPNVHFHVFPRYAGERSLDGLMIADVGWPGPPDLKSAIVVDSNVARRLKERIAKIWLSSC